MATKNMFGYGKEKEYVSFPYDWIIPGEIQYDSTGGSLVKGNWKDMLTLAEHRRDILRLEPVFWKSQHESLLTQ